MRKFLIGVVQILFLTFDWFYIPIGAALIPCFLIRRFLFPMPYWVFFVSGAVLLFVNWLIYPFGMSVMLLPVAILAWLSPSEKPPQRNDPAPPPTESGSQAPNERP